MSGRGGRCGTVWCRCQTQAGHFTVWICYLCDKVERRFASKYSEGSAGRVVDVSVSNFRPFPVTKHRRLDDDAPLGYSATND